MARNAAQYWQRFEQSWRWRKAQFDKGLVEVTVADTEPTEDSTPEEDCLDIPEASDKFNDYAVLTGWGPTHEHSHQTGHELQHPLHQRRRRQRQNLLSHPKTGETAIGRRRHTRRRVATTFTKLAAGELKERVRGALIEAGQLGVANQMEQSLIGTVNGVCGELLRRFAFEAGMPPDQQVLDEAQGDLLFYQAMERALADDTGLIRKMNTVCHRLQIIDLRKKQLLWRQEVKKIADAARANNQSAQYIRLLGKTSADQLLAHFPKATSRNLDGQLLNAIDQAIEGIDTEHDTTKATREYLSQITGMRAALYKERATWPEWISLRKKMPGAKSKPFAEAIADVAIDYDKHPRLRDDIRFFAEVTKYLNSTVVMMSLMTG